MRSFWKASSSQVGFPVRESPSSLNGQHEVRKISRQDRAPSSQSAGSGNSHSQTSSHNRTVESLLPDKAQRPSDDNATEFTSFVCPSKARTQRPVATSHRRTVLSLLPDKA